jgi:hypothetical protein
VTCLSFGRDRRSQYPDFFFCHGCDQLEDAVLVSNIKGACREMKKYMCTGGHTDVSHPTTLKKQYRPKHRKNAAAPSRKPVLCNKNPRENPDSLDTSSATVADGKNSAAIMQSAGKESPSRSPTKKKKRCQYRRRRIEREDSDDDVSSTSSDGGKNDALVSCSSSPDCAPLPDPRILFSSNTTGNSEDQELMMLRTISSVTPPESAARNDMFSARQGKEQALGERAAWVNYCINELDSSVHVDLIHKIDSLCVEISERLNLSRPRNDVQQQTTASSAATLNPEHRSTNDTATANASSHGANNDLGNSELGRKQRIVFENLELSREFSGIINDFLTRPNILSRRYFPLSRCAKIIADSILSLEWTHSEFAARFSSSKNDYNLRHGGGDAVHSTLSKMFDVSMKRHSDKSKAAILVDSLWDETFLDGEVQLCMIKKVCDYLRINVFAPWKILKAMDLAGFNLSLAGLEVLRRVDVAGKYMRGIIPSKSTILRSARKVEAAAAAFCPFKMIGRTFRDEESNNAQVNDHGDSDSDSNIGEGFEFNETIMTKTLFDSLGLTDVAKTRPVELALTSDGAQLTNNITQVSAGMKFHDMAVCDPITKELLCFHDPDSLVQSRNNSFISRMVIGHDNKKTNEGFRPLFGNFILGRVAAALNFQPFKISCPADMKAQWIALGDGGHLRGEILALQKNLN